MDALKKKNGTNTQKYFFVLGCRSKKMKTLPLLFAKLISQGDDTWHGSLGGLR